MHLTRAFLDDIRQHPEDDARRLIFADWLMEQGCTWGELIRLQVAADRLEDDDPRRLESDRHERELLRGRHDWMRLPRLPGVRWQYYRGLPGWVQVDSFNTLRKHSEALFAAAPVERVSFRTLRAVRGLAAWPALARLTALDLVRVGLDAGGAAVLAASVYTFRLTRLNLWGNAVGSEGARALAASPNLSRLTRLDVRHNGLQQADNTTLRRRFGPGVRCGPIFDELFAPAG
jgi:uncharacterized protein (TIGR02996 family)